MIFIPQNNAFYSWVVRLSPLYRYLITITIAGMIAGLWWYGVYGQIESSIDHYVKEISSLRKQINQIKRAEHSCVTLEQSIKSLKFDLQSYAQPCDEQSYVQSRVLFVLDKAQKAGLTLDAYTIDKLMDKNWYRKQKAHFDFTGSVRQVVHFFHELELSGKMICCDTIYLTHQDRQTVAIRCDISFMSLK